MCSDDTILSQMNRDNTLTVFSQIPFQYHPSITIKVSEVMYVLVFPTDSLINFSICVYYMFCPSHLP